MMAGGEGQAPEGGALDERPGAGGSTAGRRDSGTAGSGDFDSATAAPASPATSGAAANPAQPDSPSRRPAVSPSDGVRLAVDAALRGLSAADEARLLDRGRASDAAVEAAVRVILSDVRRRGDEALRGMARRFDRVDLTSIEVPRAACDAALADLDPQVRSALERAAGNIAAFHRAQLPPPLEVEIEPGVRLGRRAEPLGRVAVYAPGGRAAYPSSVLMGVVPARVAGVREVVVCSPPGPEGRPPATVLAACALAVADRVFALGGAGAIAAVAFGTRTVPACDKVVGPGNAFVTEAKRQLNGLLAVDCPAGPSEVLILADDSADPEILAAEVIAQAEHDPDAASVLVCTSAPVLEATRRELARLLPQQPRREIIQASLSARGAFLLAETVDDLVAFNNRYAPEHLLVLVREPRSLLGQLRGAGSIFLGPGSSVAFGDYLTGANHVLPTAGLGRAYAGLSTMDFLRWYTYQEVSAAAANALSDDVQVLALAEGLPGHALCARLRAADAATAQAGGAVRSDGGTAGQRDSAISGQAGFAANVGTPALAVTPSRRPAVAGARPGAVPFRASYADIELYDPKRTPIGLDLSDNTSLFGAPPAGLKAVRELGEDDVTRYPPVYAARLKEVLAELHGVAVDNVVTGCGSDDVIDSAIRAFCEPGDVVAYPEPTFSMVPWFARMNATRPWPVPMTPGFGLDDDALLSARARITYICNPNNPTGTVLERERIRRVAAEAIGVVLLDEAYVDYAPGDVSLVAEAAASQRLIVLRTLSKAFGLAGLRIGYAIGPAPLVREIEKSRGPYKITSPADAAALAALAGDRAWSAANVATVVASRERLTAELAALGCRTWPSGANFLLVQAPPAGGPGAARALAAALRARDVAVRSFPALPGGGDCIRVSIGPWPLMERFLDALRNVLQSAARSTGSTEV